MKTNIKCAIIAGILALCMVLLAHNANATTLSEVCSTWLNLREEPTTASPVKAVLNRGDAMLLYKRSGNWCYVGVNVEGKTKKGWCAASGVNGSGQIVAYITQYTPKTFGYIKPKSTNLYTKATTKSKVKIKLKKGDRVTVKDWSGLFVKVSAKRNGKYYTGYICPIYLEQSNEMNNINVSYDCLKIGFVNYRYLRLREEPTTASRCLATLSQNDILKIYSTPRGWYGVKAYHEGRWLSGFVSRDYVEIIK